MKRPQHTLLLAGILFAVSLLIGRAGLGEVVRLKIRHREPFPEEGAFGYALFALISGTRRPTVLRF